MTELVGEMAAEPDRSRLVAVVCVVDAAHILDDLRGDDYVVERRDDDAGYDYRARALLTVMQIEYASTIVLVNWSALSRNEISTVMALLNHLSPAARLRLQREKTDPIATREGYGAEQSAPGWVAILSDEFEPHMSDSRVTAFRYQQVRPLHPGRLSTLLDDKIEAGAFGTVVRSVGFCRFATRPETPVQWDHVGQMVSFEPLGRANPLDEDEDLLAIGQDLAFIGLDIDKHGLIDALDETALTDSEFTAGPMAWRRFADPFPAWHTQRAD